MTSKLTLTLTPLFAVALLLQTGAALAQSATGALGDHPLVARFPDSTLEEIDVAEDVSYRLVLGTLQRNRELVVPENSERLRGDVTKIVYQVPQEYAGEEVYDYFLAQFAEKGFVELFSCTGRSCGSSNYWANDIFSNRILYGPERNQYFSAFRLDQDGAEPVHVSLYVITRGNRRIYAYLEIVEDNLSRGVVTVASPDLLEALNARGVVTIPGIQFTTQGQLSDVVDLSAVVELIQSNSDLRFYIVGHRQGTGNLDALLQQSTARAEQVRQRLLDSGVPADRVIAQGVGPLAPVCEVADCANRIELVLRR